MIIFVYHTTEKVGLILIGRTVYLLHLVILIIKILLILFFSLIIIILIFAILLQDDAIADVKGQIGILYSSEKWTGSVSCWNYRKTGYSSTLGTLTMDESYDYIVLDATSSIVTLTGYDSDSKTTDTLSLFSNGANITIANGNNRSISGGSTFCNTFIRGAYLTIDVTGTSVTATYKFSTAEQRSGLSLSAVCLLVFKAYNN